MNPIEQKIIEAARSIAQHEPDYDPQLPLSLNDAITIILGQHIDVPSDEVYDFLESRNPKAIITVEGGIVQSVLCSNPVDVTVIEYDIDCAPEEELVSIPQENGTTEQAYVYVHSVDEVNPERVEEILKHVNS